MAVTLSFIGGAGWQFLDDNGNPLSGGKIYTYAAGTTTPLTTYTSRDGLTPNANPIILDAAGRTPQQIWSTEGLLYKYVVYSSTNVLIRSWDNIGGSEVASDLAQDLANTTDNAKGDALVGFRQSNSAGFLTGSVGRTVNSKLQEIISVLDFGADPTGVADSAAAIQAAIDYLRPTQDAHPEKGGTVLFPPGTYLINSPINLYSAVHLMGEGYGTRILGGPSLTNAAFLLSSNGPNNWCVSCSIVNMKIQTVPDLFTPVTNTIWAIKANCDIIGNCNFENLGLWVRYGLKLDTYTQNTYINNVMSIAQVDQVLTLKGNYNYITSLAKEGGGGGASATTEPYVFIGGDATYSAVNNVFEHLLIEGAGSANKSAIKLKNSDATQIPHFWHELSVTNNIIIELDRSNLYIGGTVLNGGAANNKYKLRNGSQLYFETYYNTAAYDDWQAFFDYDNTSFVSIDTMYTQLNSNRYKISTSNNLYVKNYVDQFLLLNNTPGRSALSMPHYRSGQNLFINPSFEAGAYGWNINGGAPLTTTFEPSEVAQGNMLKLITTAATIDQLIPVTAAQVGIPMTINFVIKLEGAGWAFPVISGYSSNSDTRVYAGQGWQTVTMTYYPQSSGSFYSGVSMAGGGGTTCTLYLDEMSICFGAQGLINTSKFGSFELNQRTFTTATAAPTTGTWKVGDRVFNASPSVGQPKGWICTVAGTPGTWVSEGNL